ncbi:Junctophilin-1 [Trichoplax sp. H2]|nr:Junctophilin-1 [Trichoplax sp. H2]|eukprot:RDD44096.1 Junctophilin-1 [Trichoplax sp. H2]
MAPKKRISAITIGRYNFSDGSYYCGQWDEQRLAQGFGCWTGLEMKGKFEGYYKDGLEITGAYTWPSGEIYSGQWLYGQRHGSGIQKYKTSIYAGCWNQGKRDYLGAIWNRCGSIYFGTWQDGEKTGYGTEAYLDGYYHGQFSRDERHGYGVRVSYQEQSMDISDRAYSSSSTYLRNSSRFKKKLKLRKGIAFDGGSLFSATRSCKQRKLDVKTRPHLYDEIFDINLKVQDIDLSTLYHKDKADCKLNQRKKTSTTPKETSSSSSYTKTPKIPQTVVLNNHHSSIRRSKTLKGKNYYCRTTHFEVTPRIRSKSEKDVCRNYNQSKETSPTAHNSHTPPTPYLATSNLEQLLVKTRGKNNQNNTTLQYHQLSTDTENHNQQNKVIEQSIIKYNFFNKDSNYTNCHSHRDDNLKGVNQHATLKNGIKELDLMQNDNKQFEEIEVSGNLQDNPSHHNPILLQQEKCNPKYVQAVVIQEEGQAGSNQNCQLDEIITTLCNQNSANSADNSSHPECLLGKINSDVNGRNRKNRIKNHLKERNRNSTFHNSHHCYQNHRFLKGNATKMQLSENSPSSNQCRKRSNNKEDNDRKCNGDDKSDWDFNQYDIVEGIKDLQIYINKNYQEGVNQYRKKKENSFPSSAIKSCKVSYVTENDYEANSMVHNRNGSNNSIQSYKIRPKDDRNKSSAKQDRPSHRSVRVRHSSDGDRSRSRTSSKCSKVKNMIKSEVAIDKKQLVKNLSLQSDILRNSELMSDRIANAYHDDDSVIEVYKGQWFGDKRNGYGICQRSDGPTYMGSWYNNQLSGYGELILKDGTKQRGLWKENRLIFSINDATVSHFRPFRNANNKLTTARLKAKSAARAADKRAIIAKIRAALARDQGVIANNESKRAHLVAARAKQIVQELYSRKCRGSAVETTV